MNFNLKNYRQLSAMESCGSITGSMGFQLLVSTGATEVDLKHPALQELSYVVQDLVKTALLTAILDSKPEMHERKTKEREELLGLFDGPIYVKEVPNEYGPSDPFLALSPWFIVTTRVGPIKIGWRRRVINIDWSDSDQKLIAEDLFPNEDVTKIGQVIHAWSYDKAREYVSRIVNS